MKTLEQMAVEAEIAYLAKGELHPAIREGCDTREELQRFAALVAERCAARCDELAAARPMTGAGRLIAQECAVAILAEFPKP